MNTEFANWLLFHPEVNKATSSIFKEFSSEKFPSAIINQTIRDVKSQKKNQKARTFKSMWCCFNNQNLKVEKVGDFCHRERANRNGLRFKCRSCGYTVHADLNGAINIAKAISGRVA